MFCSIFFLSKLYIAVQKKKILIKLKINLVTNLFASKSIEKKVEKIDTFKKRKRVIVITPKNCEIFILKDLLNEIDIKNKIGTEIR